LIINLIIQFNWKIFNCHDLYSFIIVKPLVPLLLYLFSGFIFIIEIFFLHTLQLSMMICLLFILFHLTYLSLLYHYVIRTILLYSLINYTIFIGFPFIFLFFGDLHLKWILFVVIILQNFKLLIQICFILIKD